MESTRHDSTLFDTLKLQGRLISLGILDPPADGIHGSQTALALRVLKAAGARLPPIDTNAKNFATALWLTLAARGHWLARVPGYLNIAYIEGAKPDGSPNRNSPNHFNDLRVVLTIRNGAPAIVGKWQATTEPGRFYTENPLSPKGAARIAFGQYKAWVVGTHRDHEALIQRGPVRVHRDLNRDYLREGDAVETSADFGINQHWGYDLPEDNIGPASAGCLVGQTRAGHKRFMSLLKQDPRYLANPGGYRFMTAILSAADLQPYL